MFNEYPYRNLTDVNLDYILKHIKDLETNLQDFIKLNTIKYADPIDWNISKQYETNTVVVNEFTGVAYLSTKPVPSGVDVTNTDYWTPIFTLDFVNMNKNITLRNDGNNNNATFASVTGDWLIVGGQLYKVIQDISLHTAYVVGYNIQIYSVELFVRDYLNQVLNLIGGLDDLTTSDKTSVVNAINSIVSDINLLSIYVTPEMFGAIGDGVTDDTDAIRDALTSGKNVIFGAKTYLVNADSYNESENAMVAFNIPSDRCIIMQPATILKLAPCTRDKYYIFYAKYSENVLIMGGNIEGDRLTHVVAGTDPDPYLGIGIRLSLAKHVTVKDINVYNTWGDCIYIGDDSATERAEDIHFINCNFSDGGRNNVSLINVDTVSFDKCTFKNATYQSPRCGIDFEINHYDRQFVKNITIRNCTFSNNGFDLYFKRMGAQMGRYEIVDCSFDGAIYRAISFDECSVNSYPSELSSGYIIIKNCLIERCMPFMITNKFYDGYKVDVVDCLLHNVQNETTYEDGNYDCIIDWRTPYNATGATFGGVNFYNLVFDCNRMASYLINPNVGEQKQNIKITIGHSRNAPQEYVPVNSDSRFVINVADETWYSTNRSSFYMHEAGRGQYPHLILTEPDASVEHQIVRFGGTSGDYSPHVVTNTSSKYALVYIGNDSVILQTGQSIHAYYVDEVSKWVFYVV